jgi:hypothetical protein
MTQLTQEQKELVRQWAAAGATLPEIQKKIKEELKIPVTFMETRFLVLDLNMDIKEKTPVAQANIDLSKPSSAGAENEVPGENAAPGGVSVELDRVVKAGAIVSGKVTFSDGETAAWSLDQFGRLALAPANTGYRPNQDDLQSFQQELARLIQSRGF